MLGSAHEHQLDLMLVCLLVCTIFVSEMLERCLGKLLKYLFHGLGLVHRGIVSLLTGKLQHGSSLLSHKCVYVLALAFDLIGTRGITRVGKFGEGGCRREGREKNGAREKDELTKAEFGLWSEFGGITDLIEREPQLTVSIPAISKPVACMQTPYHNVKMFYPPQSQCRREQKGCVPNHKPSTDGQS